MNYYADYSNRLNPNGYDTNRGQIQLGVLHDTCGPNDFNPGNILLGNAAANYLAGNNDRQVSIHYIVGPEGPGAPIYRCVPEQYVAYHAGGSPPAYPSVWTNPDTGITYNRYQVNQISIGIERFGQWNEAPGPQQLAQLKALVLDIAGHNTELRKADHWVSHKSLEGDRQDGQNTVALVRGWIAEAYPVWPNGTGTGGGTKPVDNTDPNADPNSWHAIVPGIGDFWVVQPVLDYWRKNGGLAEFGYPLSGLRPSTTTPALNVQYFERHRLEVDSSGNITRGRLGAELLAALGDKAP